MKSLDKENSKFIMSQVNKRLAITLWLLLLALCAAGCCNSQFKVKQLGDDLHTYFADGDPEALSEAEPDSPI